MAMASEKSTPDTLNSASEFLNNQLTSDFPLLYVDYASFGKTKYRSLFGNNVSLTLGLEKVSESYDDRHGNFIVWDKNSVTEARQLLGIKRSYNERRPSRYEWVRRAGRVGGEIFTAAAPVAMGDYVGDSAINHLAVDAAAIVGVMSLIHTVRRRKLEKRTFGAANLIYRHAMPYAKPSDMARRVLPTEREIQTATIAGLESPDSRQLFQQLLDISSNEDFKKSDSLKVELHSLMLELADISDQLDKTATDITRIKASVSHFGGESAEQGQIRIEDLKYGYANSLEDFHSTVNNCLSEIRQRLEGIEEGKRRLGIDHIRSATMSFLSSGPTRDENHFGGVMNELYSHAANWYRELVPEHTYDHSSTDLRAVLSTLKNALPEIADHLNDTVVPEDVMRKFSEVLADIETTYFPVNAPKTEQVESDGPQRSIGNSSQNTPANTGFRGKFRQAIRG